MILKFQILLIICAVLNIIGFLMSIRQARNGGWSWFDWKQNSHNFATLAIVTLIVAYTAVTLAIKTLSGV